MLTEGEILHFVIPNLIGKPVIRNTHIVSGVKLLGYRVKPDNDRGAMSLPLCLSRESGNPGTIIATGLREYGREEDAGGHTFQLRLKVFRQKTQGYKPVPTVNGV